MLRGKRPLIVMVVGGQGGERKEETRRDETGKVVRELARSSIKKQQQNRYGKSVVGISRAD